jgi:hypothetical protein
MQRNGVRSLLLKLFITVTGIILKAYHVTAYPRLFNLAPLQAKLCLYRSRQALRAPES